MKTPLREIAHARAGDKGNTSNIAVFAKRPEYWPLLREQLTADAVARALAGLVQGEVTRYEVESLHAFNFVMTGALEGGVNASLNLDSHGKSWSFLVLAMPVEVPDARTPRPNTTPEHDA